MQGNAELEFASEEEEVRYVIDTMPFTALDETGVTTKDGYQAFCEKYILNHRFRNTAR